MAEINVVPYIDVSLVLLIIFMITTPLLQSGVDVELTKTDSETKTADPNKAPPIIVSIKQTGEIFIDVGDQNNLPVDGDALREKTLAAIKDKPGREVWVSGDKSVEYGTILVVMASLKKAGVPRVGLMTQPKE
jgi:biopolymer transport protein TolR